jgi:hypothetical protein
MEWSDIVPLDGGVFFPHTCRLKHYRLYAVPETNERLGIQRAYEHVVRTFTFSNVKINQPLDEQLFVLNPPVGTNVVDEIAGHRYLVGSAGEQLQKTALQLREPAGREPPGPRWGTFTVIGSAGVLVLVLLGVLYARHRSKLRAAG